MNVVTATPVEIDTELARLHDVYSALDMQRTHEISTAHRLNGERAVYRGRQRVWEKSAEETLNELALKLADEQLKRWDVKDATECITSVAELDKKLAATRSEIDALNTEYDSRPWSRFVSVKDGHVHSGTRCIGGTIGITTQIGWHPELSGKSEADAVDLLGERLCSHCFPSAPVAWTVGTKPKTERCEGSGKQEVHGTVNVKRMKVTGKCTGCATMQPLTQHGVVRAHKPAKA